MVLCSCSWNSRNRCVHETSIGNRQGYITNFIIDKSALYNMLIQSNFVDQVPTIGMFIHTTTSTHHSNIMNAEGHYIKRLITESGQEYQLGIHIFNIIYI